VGAFLESLKGRLNEVQILKLELLKERKKHEDTKRQLDEVKSNRTSAVFSDYDSSCCSGFDSSDVEMLLKELEEEKKRREAAERRTTEIAESHQFFLRHFKSLEDAQIALNSCREVTKWPSIDSGAQMKEFTSCRNSFIEDDNTGVLALAEKVTLLESQLEDEVNKREEAEFEIMKLASDNRDLHDELFETRDRLFAASQHDIREDDFDGDMWDPEYTEQCATRDDSMSSYEVFTLGRIASCPSLNQDNFACNQHDDVQLRLGRRRMSRPVSYHGDTSMSHVWRNRNTEHYEMDQYEDEIKKKLDPRDKDFRFALRRLKLDTWNLYNDVVMDGAMIKSISNRAKRISLG
ncbi:hypothetical protein QZH41_020711, partial [Actinostola sp. cb2023]